jgi:hypothetical protein
LDLGKTRQEEHAREPAAHDKVEQRCEISFERDDERVERSRRSALKPDPRAALAVNSIGCLLRVR